VSSDRLDECARCRNKGEAWVHMVRLRRKLAGDQGTRVIKKRRRDEPEIEQSLGQSRRFTIHFRDAT
jgi:hypothetical protein